MEIKFSIEEIQEIARKVLAQNPKKIIFFKGEMGVGKTTFIKELCRELGVESPTSSPTFSLVNEYHTNGNGKVFHFDFYRLKKDTEALDMGVDEYLFSGNWCFIEWAERVEELIPMEHSTIFISENPDGKRLLQYIA